MSERNPLAEARPEAARVEESGGRSVGGSEAPAAASNPESESEENVSLLKQLTVGTVVDGKYAIDEIIGRGAMGVVVAATHVHLKERVALKFLNARAGGGEDFHMRFRREAQVSAKLRNEHITRVIDVGVWREKLPFMVMDHLSGNDLRRTLKLQGPLPLNIALDYVVQICEGLSEAHSYGIIHRDLKPSNLFVTKRPDGSDLIKILDFGISKWSTQEHEVEELTQTGVVLGSPKYMSPEQLFGSSAVDARADVWSIGAIFYEMLTGRPPYDFPTLTRICAELAADKPPPSLRNTLPDVPPALEAIVMQCFARDREHRVHDVAELAGALLDSVEAPFAGQVRQRIASILDPKSAGASLATSSGGLALSAANYRSLSISGTSSPIHTSSGAIRVADLPAMGPESRRVPPEKKRGPLVVGAIFGVAIVACALFFLLGKGTPEHSTVAPAQSPGVAAAISQAPETPAPTPAPTAALTPAAPASAASASASAAPVNPGAHPASGGGHGTWHPQHPHPQAPAPTPNPAAAAAAAPTPPPQPPPAPTPAPTPKQPSNPLEDRQ